MTAGNASTLNDGAAALVVISEEFAKAHGLDDSGADRCVRDGRRRAAGSVLRADSAVGNLMGRENSKIGDYDLIEANEAFASQALADGDALGWDSNAST